MQKTEGSTDSIRHGSCYDVTCFPVPCDVDCPASPLEKAKLGIPTAQSRKEGGLKWALPAWFNEGERAGNG
jgi:hypothetical protein